MTRQLEYSVKDLQRGLRRAWRRTGLLSGRRRRPGLRVTEIIRASRKRNNGVRLDRLDLWLVVLDEIISWYVSLFTISMLRLRRGRLSKTQRNVLRCFSVLAPRIASDLISVRILCEAGFDVAAKTVVRSTIEYIDICAYLSMHPDAGGEFIRTQDRKRSNAFWRKYVKGGGPNGSLVRQAMISAMARQDNDREAVQGFVKWLYSGNDVLLMSSHPSFTGAFFSNIVLGTPEEDGWLGIFGAKGEVSIITIHEVVRHVFKFLVLAGDAPFKVGKAPSAIRIMNYKKQDEMHRHVRLGREALVNLYAFIANPRLRNAFFGRTNVSSLEHRRRRIKKHPQVSKLSKPLGAIPAAG